MSAPSHRRDAKDEAATALPIVILIAALIVTVVVICAVLGERIAPDSPFLQRLGVGDTPPSAESTLRGRIFSAAMSCRA